MVDEQDTPTPTVLNDDDVSAPAKKQRARRELEIPAEVIAKIKAELREELAAERPAPRGAFDPKGMPTTLPDGTVVWEFWAETPYHEHRIKRPTGDGFIHFQRGYFRARTESDRDLILTHLRGKAWPKTWPDDQPRPVDPKTGFSPGSFEAWQAFLQHTRPAPFNSL